MRSKLANRTWKTYWWTNYLLYDCGEIGIKILTIHYTTVDVSRNTCDIGTIRANVNQSYSRTRETIDTIRDETGRTRTEKQRVDENYAATDGTRTLGNSGTGMNPIRPLQRLWPLRGRPVGGTTRLDDLDTSVGSTACSSCARPAVRLKKKKRPTHTID